MIGLSLVFSTVLIRSFMSVMIVIRIRRLISSVLILFLFLVLSLLLLFLLSVSVIYIYIYIWVFTYYTDR